MDSLKSDRHDKKDKFKRIVRSQIFRTAVIGIPSGLIVGGIVSLGLVPFAMNYDVLKRYRPWGR